MDHGVVCHSLRCIRFNALLYSLISRAEQSTCTGTRGVPGWTVAFPSTDLPSACCFCRIKESFISQTLNAFDFAEVRSKKDRELLYEAKYGERGGDVSITSIRAVDYAAASEQFTMLRH